MGKIANSWRIVPMPIEKTIAIADATDMERAYLLGGACAIVLGISYIIITALYIHVGAPPSGGEAWLAYLARHTDAWWAITFLSILTDILFFPVALSLYYALKDINRNATTLGTGLIGLFAILDLAVTWPNYASLITLSGNYTAAAGNAQRSVYIAAANYASAVLTSHLFAVYAILVPALGILVISLVMLKVTSGKSAAYVGVATGILGVISVAGPFFINALSAAAIITSIFTIVWILFIGHWLIGARRLTPRV
jgi:hypothetical protein